MPIVSPEISAGQTLTCSISVNGTALEDTYPLVSIRTYYEINKIAYAEVELIDGAPDTGVFVLSEKTTLIPGSEISINAGYDSDNNLIFSGVIVKQAIRISNDRTSNLLLTCKHKAVQMTYNRNDSVFLKKKDSEIISSIISNYSLTATVDATTFQYENLYQKSATDWDFILARADFCGLVVNLKEDDVFVKKPVLDSSPVLSVTYGESIYSLNAEFDGEGQVNSVEAIGWDPSKLAISAASKAAEPSLNEHGNLEAKTLSKGFKNQDLTLYSGTPMDSANLKLWANSKLLRIRLSALKGSVTFKGSSKVNTGDMITLAGLGDRYNGNAYVSVVEHTIEEGTWITKVDFGLDSKPVSEFPQFSYSPSTGQFPAIHGLQVGIVKQLDKDPQSEFRLSVTIPGMTGSETLWARMASIYASNAAGFYFLPEIGDEVILGFIDDDPSHPVILGSLYSSKHAAAYANEAKNNTKAITTRSKMEINFDEEKKIIKISTPGGNSIILDDDEKGITIKDQNSNTLKLNSSGIEMESPKNIVIKATGDITLDATGKLSLQSKQDVTVEGLNITNTAKVGFTAKGSASAEISASGQTIVKGAMVMIN
jgi:Rhs element Vgr protein